MDNACLSISTVSSIYIYGFPSGSDGTETACNAGNLGSIPGSGRVPEEGKMDNVCLSISIISSI